MNTTSTPSPIPSNTDNLNSTLWLIGIITACIACAIILILCTVYCCIKCQTHTRNQSPSNTAFKYPQHISNGLAVIIAIGDYDNVNTLNNKDINDGHLLNLPLQTDIDNLIELFTILNYKIVQHPSNYNPSEHKNKPKTHWTEDEVIKFLQYDIIKELKQNHGIYDGLIVCVTCHGIKHHIITSDYRTIEKTVIHRIISVTYPKSRDLPRIFIFDSCEGTEQRVKSIGPFIKRPTVDVSAFLEAEDEIDSTQILRKPSTFKQNSTPFGTPRKTSTPKHISLESVSTGRSWTTSTKNPDFQLAVIHAANAGFQSKLHRVNGSYVIYGFTQKMKLNLRNKRNRKTLRDIFEEIQDELHDLGKQQTVNVFNNGTRYIELRKNDGKVKEERICDEKYEEDKDERVILKDVDGNVTVTPKGERIVQGEDDDMKEQHFEQVVSKSKLKWNDKRSAGYSQMKSVSVDKDGKIEYCASNMTIVMD